jgi:hypothetical protein
MVSGPNSKAVREETRKIRRLQRVVALAQQMLANQVRTKGEALTLVDGVRNYALELFPDKGDTFDLIYSPRLQRILDQRFNASRPDRGVEGGPDWRD